MWIKATYEFGSLFSYRVPGFSSQYAMSLPVPAPTTIKLAIVSASIQNSRSVKTGGEILDAIKDAEIRISPPNIISTTSFLIKRLKAVKDKKSGKNFETTFGIRGYVHIPSEFSIFINVDESYAEKTKDAMRKIRYFGTSDSLAHCKEICQEDPGDTSIDFTLNTKSLQKNTMIIPVKDLNKEFSFDDVNPFKKKNDSKRKEFKNKFCCLRFSAPPESGKNWVVYRFS